MFSLALLLCNFPTVLPKPASQKVLLVNTASGKKYCPVLVALQIAEDAILYSLSSCPSTPVLDLVNLLTGFCHKIFQPETWVKWQTA